MFNQDKYPYCYSGYLYAKDILDGVITSNIYVRKACERFISDMEKSKNDYCPYYFDPERAEKFLRLAQRFKHVKGEWKDPCIIYEPWQNFAFMNVYGFILKKTNSRRFRTAHIEVARGNGKSAIASQVGLYHLSLENPKGNEVYSAATGKDQARIVLDSARAMAKANKSFLKHTGTRVLAHQILHDSTNSFFKALSSDSNTLDGLQPACAIIDELHAHKNRSVFDVIDSAMTKRRDSLLLVITTAGFDTSGIGYSQSVYAKKVSLGEVEDDSFFALVFTLDEEDDPMDESVWIKANPNMGVSVDPDNFKNKANKAKENPEDLNNFKVKHLNVWTNAMNPYFNIAKWNLCKEDMRIEEFVGEKCWVGIDMSSKIDLTSFSYVFKRESRFYLFNDIFIPEQTIADSHNNSYGKWVSEGFLKATKGEAINYPWLLEYFVSMSKKFKILGAHYDPWSASEFSQRASAKRIEMIEFRMSTANLSEPMKSFDAKIREGHIAHIGSGLDRWCLGNVVAKRDANDNVFPRKENEKLKIDPIISSIMAMAGWIQDEEQESVYEKRGLIIV